MKKYLLIIVFFLISCTATANEVDPLKNIDPEIALKAVEKFRANPVSEFSMGYLAVIVNFAEQSDDVYVEINEDYFPAQFWAIESELQQLFLGAYIAGNIEPQLLFESKSNQSLDGIRFMLNTYVVMRDLGRLENISGFEDFISLDSDGKLSFE